MRRPPAPLLTPTPGIAALIGMLGALLYALLGWSWQSEAQPVDGLEGALTGVLVAEAAISFETEPYVEWVAVPVPWRPLHCMLRERRRLRRRPLRLPAMRTWIAGRGPPARAITGLA